MKLKKKEIYFDNASSSKIIKKIKKTIPFSCYEFWADTNNYHQAALKAKSKIEQARLGIAKLLNVSPATIRFTSNGTEANNLAISLVDDKFNAIITSKYEHKSVLKTLKIKSEQKNIPIFYVNTFPDSTVDLKHLKSLLQENPNSFVSLAHVNMYTGRLLQLRRVTELCHKYQSVFHSDMSLTLGKLDINLQKPDVDIATASSHKLASVRGAGIIYKKREIEIPKIIYGNANEFDFRPGAENIYAIFAMFKTLEYLYKNNLKISTHIKNLKKILYAELDKRKIQYNSVSKSEIHFLSHINLIYFYNNGGFDKFKIKLDLNDIYIFPVDYMQQKSIRISFGEKNTKKEVKEFVRRIKNIMQEK
jgi:cysteine desulfurase